MSEDLSYLRSEYARNKTVEGYDMEMKERERKEAEDDTDRDKVQRSATGSPFPNRLPR